MHNILLTATAAAILFSLAVLAMAVGLLLRGKIMRGGCSSSHAPSTPAIGCGACSKKKLNLCNEKDAANLAGPSFAATMGRFNKKS